jgi:hypothetical protein
MAVCTSWLRDAKLVHARGEPGVRVRHEHHRAERELVSCADGPARTALSKTALGRVPSFWEFVLGFVGV